MRITIIYIIKDTEKASMFTIHLSSNSLSIHTSTLQCFSQLFPFLVSAHHTLNSPTAGDGTYIENTISIIIVILYINKYIYCFIQYLSSGSL